MSLLLSIRPYIKIKIGFILLITILLLGSLFPIELPELPEMGNLTTRLSATQTFSNEERWVEITMLFDQMRGSDYWIGLGFGSRFHSPVVVEGIDLAISPHIAIFTFLQKGGLFLFLGVIVIPYLLLLWRILWGRGPTVQQAIWSGAFMYLVLASMSSGWEFYNLFLYGSFMAVKLPFHLASGVPAHTK